MEYMNRINVLIVDDNEVVRDLARLSVAHEHDINVVAEAGHGQEAIQLCQVFSPDLILMDIEMPIMSGIEATRIIKEASPEVKVIIYSSHFMNESKVKQSLVYADKFLAKPAGKQELIATIRQTFWEGTEKSYNKQLEAS